MIGPKTELNGSRRDSSLRKLGVENLGATRRFGGLGIGVEREIGTRRCWTLLGSAERPWVVGATEKTER